MTLSWSAYAVSLARPDAPPILDESADLVLKTASVGKLLLLGEVARRLESGVLQADRRVSKQDAQFVRDSGLWHLLDQQDLTVLDACRLVGAVSDNLATNVLIDLVGLGAVQDFGASIGAPPMELLDYVSDVPREQRGPGTPPTLSRASARSLVGFLTALQAGVVSPLVGEWMSLNTDLSMVASAFLDDPLAHNEIGGDDQPGLRNKTGTDDGIRADVGIVTNGSDTVAYAVVANWAGDDAAPGLATVMSRMREHGDTIRAALR
ncbi:serine hydrolase [Flexivirga meconopsidis]|uniref:serine hydrolase n=1 Tax=Flexivirga meconopsidis TaxID=2977121 RepID=UPI00223F0CB3|nr:serine hydrolase [Flexivirga meconopsidis]